MPLCVHQQMRMQTAARTSEADCDFFPELVS
jgi:hypothetical protein